MTRCPTDQIYRLTMLVVGGFLLTPEQLCQLARRRGLDISANGSTAAKLNADFVKRNISSIYCLPVSWPRGTKMVDPILHFMIVTQRGDQLLKNLSSCKPMEQGEDEKKVKSWLELNGINNTSFQTIPDPFFTQGDGDEGMDWD